MILVRVKAATLLFASAIYDLVASSIDVARIVVARNPQPHPAIIVFPVRLKTRWGVGLLANLVSLTPGSTCLHIEEDMSALYIHVLDSRQEEKLIREFRTLFEHRIRELEG
ncbi:Na+/H+ antiporter subunit E [Geminicoccus roseus]|uniref:Na+/H+ antiporter subunit E n=1 Tax=Geminicoccus roseus TaxID=404900 RepID=UPI000429801B|nr:Na+/H+ antiporter subunit E [Geminicoccus roseus]